MESMNIKISRALMVLAPNAQWILSGDDYANLEWLDDKQTAPTWDQVQVEINNPTLTPEPTIEDKLGFVGLTLPDLKSALGLL